MKRLHVHISVKELGKSIAFYSTLFDAQPSVEKNDYAKWMLDDPAVNFAISTSGEKAGLDHLGFQVDSDEALEAVHQQLDAAAVAGHSENEAECCYAKSNKYWTMDPAGIPWENFHSLEQIETFGKDDHIKACCNPRQNDDKGARCCG